MYVKHKPMPKSPPHRHKKTRPPKARPRQRTETEKARALPRNSPELSVEITRIGARGDGIGKARYTVNYQTGDYNIFVPGTLAGEIVRVRPHSITAQGLRAEIIELLSASPHRRTPPCPHFGQCGGCQLQHLSTDIYRSWKSEQLFALMEQAGLSTGCIQTPFWGEDFQRRRATFAYKQTKNGLLVGFFERQSHFIIPAADCIILNSSLSALIAGLGDWGDNRLGAGASGRLQVNQLDSGPDITIYPDQLLSAAALSALAAAAAKLDCVRLSIVQPDSDLPLTLIMPKTALLNSFGLDLVPPPAAFLQASTQGEVALRAFVSSSIEQNSLSGTKIIDLFCGCGTLSAQFLSRGCHLHACDSDSGAVTAFEQAANQAGYGQNARFDRRNLITAPLLPDQLNGADYVIMDPPRSGAGAQAKMLASSTVKTVIMISCHLHSFVRDMSVLVHDGGYEIDTVQLIDQFIYSPHCEIAACLRRPGGIKNDDEG